MEIKLCCHSSISVALFIIVSSCVGLSEGQYYGQKTPLTPDQICEQFSKGKEGMNEFYTPLWPNKYPNKTECVLKISAEFGFLIRVDFRDYFDIEPSENCENDFLEIRDGPHGYSDLMGKYCGSEFPPIITSKDRHLWLRFTSDDSLQYKGFRAVYDFVKNSQIDRPEIHPCRFEISGAEGTVSYTDIPEYRFNYSIAYKVALDCTWHINVAPNQKIYLFFEDFKLAEPNECLMNYVDIFGDERDLRSRIKHYCGSVADPVVTTGHKMYFRFFALPGAIRSDFKAWFTAFRDRMQDKSTACEADEYDCDDATCIAASLKCNGIKNCRHEYDEEGCEKDLHKKFDISSKHIIVILTLGCGLLAGMCFAMFFNCIKKLVRDGRQIHENIRRSREQLEDRRSTSMGSTPQLLQRDQIVDVEEAYERKKNGHTSIQDDDEEDTEEEDTEDEDEDESCVEMRDCECQTRDSIASHRDSGLNNTPTPPPPPTRRPPNPPSSPPLSVPTPPPPPGYYDRHRHSSHTEVYGLPTYDTGGLPTYNTRVPQSSSDHYEEDDSSSDPYKQKHRTEALIQMKARPSRYETSISEKSTPDVLVTH